MKINGKQIAGFKEINFSSSENGGRIAVRIITHKGKCMPEGGLFYNIRQFNKHGQELIMAEVNKRLANYLISVKY